MPGTKRFKTSGVVRKHYKACCNSTKHLYARELGGALGFNYNSVFSNLDVVAE